MFRIVIFFQKYAAQHNTGVAQAAYIHIIITHNDTAKTFVGLQFMDGHLEHILSRSRVRSACATHVKRAKTCARGEVFHQHFSLRRCT
jgi:hypothetical protein